jgi:dienelactone hydrolase
MKVIDGIVLLTTLTIALCLIITPKRIYDVFHWLVILTIILAIVQYFLTGLYWQNIPIYFLIVLLISKALVMKTTGPSIQTKFFQIILLLLVLASAGTWSTFLPIPTLTEPQGQFKTGTSIFRLIDNDRDEQITSDPNDKRNVVIQAWYPTVDDATGGHSIYLDGMDNLPEKISIIPSFLLDHYDQIKTNGVLNAPISKAQNQWPVIIFLTGNGATRSLYTSITSGLASHGFVVLAIDHPYEAAITQLANGEIVTTIEARQKDDPDLLKFMKARLDLRVADVSFVINQLFDSKAFPDSFSLSLNQKRIGIAGHSLGGASGAATMAVDSRIKAAANIDGTLYGELPEPFEPRPYLLLESNKQDKERLVRYESGNQQLFKHFRGGLRYEIIAADHYSFTDAPLFLALPTRMLAGQVLGFGNIPDKTHRATVEILATFFKSALQDKLPDIDPVVARYKGITRKSVDK